MASKHKNNDADTLDMPKRSLKVLPLSEKVFMYRKKHRTYRVGYYPWFQASTGESWNISSVDKEGLLYSHCFFSISL